MRQRHILPLLMLAAFALPASPASADYRIGIGEQDPSMFDASRFQELGVKRIRLMVPWDWYRHDYQVAETTAFMNRARSAGADVLVSFTAARGCYQDGRYSRRRACKPPSARRYGRSLERFLERFPRVDTFSPWNEVNHVSQPTYERPALAARYYRVAKEECGDCRIVAADVLDSSNVRRYLRGFLRAIDGRTPRLWGLHNYADVNRRRSRGIRAVLRTVPGQVWLTETGGIVSFGREWPYSERRAANRTRYMFGLINRFTKRHPSRSGRLTRLYVYQWNGRERGTAFDSGLTDADGGVRPAYRVVRNRMDGRYVLQER